MKIFIKFSVILIIITFIAGLYFISQDSSNKFSKFVKDTTPTHIKIFLKEKIFFIPIKLREIESTNNAYTKLLDERDELLEENIILKNELNKGKYNKEIIKNYIFKSFVVPIYKNDETKNNVKEKIKKTGYIENYNDKIIIVLGSGKILYLNKSDFDKEVSEFRNINSNLKDKNYFNNLIKWTGVKDVKIVDETIFLSLTEEIKKDCYNTSLVSSNINLEFLKFEKVFSTNECANIKTRIQYFKYFNGHQNGGRIEWLNNRIYLTIGDYNVWELPQNDKSVFGKIIEIDVDKKNYKIISKGHRNQQGLKVYSKNDKILISTEHGPKGGDEINLIKITDNKISNYGWPISSYGSHYDIVPYNSHTKKYAPLHKSHVEHGFEEPIYFFNESIGISEIIKNYKKDNVFFITSLKNQSIYEIEFDEKFNFKKVLNKFEIKERIRDIIYDSNSECYYIYGDTTPKIISMCNKN